jgi:hypothetical protein
VETGFAEDSAQFSPDGRWIVYESNESGRFEVYVQALPTPRGKWQVSIGGGTLRRWRPDGKELFCVAPDGRLMATPLTIRDERTGDRDGSTCLVVHATVRDRRGHSEPRPLARPLYVVAADGRFLLSEAVETATGDMTVLTVVLDWDAALQGR